jgi:FkbM family methyltransferase
LPWSFRLARLCMRLDMPGAWRLYRLLGHPLIRGKAAPFPLGQCGELYIPLTWPGLLTGRGLDRYEPGAIGAFAAAIRQLGPGVILIDCGADIGAVSRLTMALASNISKAVAFEPNPDPFGLLAINLSGLSGIEADLRNCAVSDRPGTAMLVIDRDADHDHGAHLGDGGALPTRVETIDQLRLDRNHPVALKIDVEGEELKVIQGSRETLSRAPGFAVQLEAHPGVAKRTGIDPCLCLAALQELGAGSFTAYCERSGEVIRAIDPAQPFFRQARAEDIYDVVAVTPAR